jgi:hypothetical protein
MPCDPYSLKWPEYSNHTVLFKPLPIPNEFRGGLFSSHYHQSAKELQDHFKHLIHSHRKTSDEKLVIVEFISFPFSSACRSCAVDVIMHQEQYDLLWYYKSLFPLKEVNMKLLWMNRDWWSQISAHWAEAVQGMPASGNDGNKKQHIINYANFHRVIGKEYTAIRSFDNSSRCFEGVQYEWFSTVPVEIEGKIYGGNKTDCKKLARSLYDFLEWTPTGEEDLICKKLPNMFKTPRLHPRDTEGYYELAMKHYQHFDIQMII